MTHRTEEQFRRLIEGDLDPDETNSLIYHLDNCEVCLDRLSQWYEEQDFLLGTDKEPAVPDAFKDNLMRRIHREEVARAVVSFGYNGLLSVLTFMLKSISGMGSKKPDQ